MGKVEHRKMKALHNTQLMRDGNRTITHVFLTLNPVLFRYPGPPFLGVRWHCQILGRRGGGKAVHIGGRSQEQLEISWLE